MCSVWQHTNTRNPGVDLTMLTWGEEVSIPSLTASHKLCTNLSKVLKSKRDGHGRWGREALEWSYLCIFPHVYAACPATESQVRIWLRFEISSSYTNKKLIL